MASVVTAPWTDDQVQALNDYQRAGLMHPYTCGTCRDRGVPGECELMATFAGWWCPHEERVVQTWAHEQMADPSFVPAVRETLSRLRHDGQ